MDEKSKIIDKAQKLVQKGYIDKAIVEYKRLTEKDPKDPTIRLRIGDLYVKIGKKDEAIKEYGEVAKIHTQRGFYLKAIAVYKQILKLDENLIEIHFKLSDLYAKQGLRADAIAALSVLTGFYEKKAKVDEVVDILKKMVTVDPQNVGVRLKLADYYQKKGFTEDALAEYGIVFKNLIDEGKPDKAEKLYQGLYEANKKDVRIIEGLAEVCRIKGESSQLVGYYKQLAVLYGEKGDAEKRKEAYRKILEVSPDDREAIEVVGRKPAAVEMPSREAVPSEPSLGEKEIEKPLISWPEVDIELSSGAGKMDTGEPVVSAQPQEGLMISWDEMIEEHEAKSAESAAPVETNEAETAKEQPVVEVEERAVAGEEVWKTEEPLLIDVDVEKFVSAAEEKAPIEETAETPPHEAVEASEEFLPVEDAVGGRGAAVEETAVSSGLEGLEGFIPEGAKVMEVIESSAEEGYVDLSAELGLEEALDFLTESWAPDARGEETFTEFKRGVEKQLGKEDTETHYNLGIAYMEMGLYDDAMREFKIALKDHVFEFDCYTRIGLSLMTKGDYEEAVSNFLKGLKVGGRTDEERRGLMYELGLEYEASGDYQEALEVFKSIYEGDKRFREVSSKVKELTKKVKKEDREDDIPSRDDILEVELL